MYVMFHRRAMTNSMIMSQSVRARNAKASSEVGTGALSSQSQRVRHRCFSMLPSSIWRRLVFGGRSSSGSMPGQCVETINVCYIIYLLQSFCRAKDSRVILYLQLDCQIRLAGELKSRRQAPVKVLDTNASSNSLSTAKLKKPNARFARGCSSTSSSHHRSLITLCNSSGMEFCLCSSLHSLPSIKMMRKRWWPSLPLCLQTRRRWTVVKITLPRPWSTCSLCDLRSSFFLAVSLGRQFRFVAQFALVPSGRKAKFSRVQSSKRQPWSTSWTSTSTAIRMQCAQELLTLCKKFPRPRWHARVSHWMIRCREGHCTGWRWSSSFGLKWATLQNLLGTSTTVMPTMKTGLSSIMIAQDLWRRFVEHQLVE